MDQMGRWLFRKPTDSAGTGPTLVIDPHLPDSERHQVLVLGDGLVSEIRAYPDRAAALAAFEAMQ